MKKLIIVASVVVVASVGVFALSNNNIQPKSNNEVTRRVTAENKVSTPEDTTTAPAAPAEEVAQPAQPVVEQPKVAEPVPAPVVPEMSQVEKTVRAMAEKQGVNPNTLVNYATCTSNMNPQNTYTNARGQKGMGLFGFSAEDFDYFRTKHHVTSQSPYDVEYQSFMAAKLLAGGDTWIFCK